MDESVSSTRVTVGGGAALETVTVTGSEVNRITKRISRDRHQGMEPIARGGRVPEDRIRSAGVFRAKVDAVKLELDTRDQETDSAHARADGDRAGDGSVGGWGRNGHHQAAWQRR